MISELVNPERTKSLPLHMTKGHYGGNSGYSHKGSILTLYPTNPPDMNTSDVHDWFLSKHLAHEIGHAFGLGHTSISDALMFYATMDKRVALGQDDIDGMTYLYPAEQPKVLSCGSVNLNSTNHPNWWGGFLVGLGLVFLFSKARKLTRSTTLF